MVIWTVRNGGLVLSAWPGPCRVHRQPRRVRRRDVGVGQDHPVRADQRARTLRRSPSPPGPVSSRTVAASRVLQHRGGRPGRRVWAQGEEPVRRQPGHRREGHARQGAPAHPAAQDPPAVVVRDLGAGQRGSDAEFLAGSRIAEAQDHRLGDAQRPGQPLAVEERPAPGLVHVRGPARIGGDHAVGVPRHHRVHRHQLERRVAAHPDRRPRREYALLAAEPRDQDRCLAPARPPRRRHLSFCGHRNHAPLSSIRPGGLSRQGDNRQVRPLPVSAEPVRCRCPAFDTRNRRNSRFTADGNDDIDVRPADIRRLRKVVRFSASELSISNSDQLRRSVPLAAPGGKGRAMTRHSCPKATTADT